MKRTQLAGLTGLLALSGVGGYAMCGSPDCEDPGYLTVNVIQADGDGFKPASVPTLEYTVEEDPRGDAPDDRSPYQPLSATCLDEACTKWKVAPGDNGEIHVKAQACGQSFEEVTLVDRDEEGCNHGDKEIDLIVDLTSCSPGGDGGSDAPTDITNKGEKACTLEIRPSIELHLWKKHSDYFSPATPESVKYVYKGGGTPSEVNPPASCVDDRCTTWNIGAEQAGAFDIEVTSCGKTQIVHAGVKADACHVMTERLDVVLEGFECLTNEVQPGDAQPPKLDETNAEPDADDKIDETVPKPQGPAGRLENGCNPGDPAGTAFVAYTVKQHGDMLVPVEVDKLSYSVDGKRPPYPAKCDGYDPCNKWMGEGKGPGLYELTAPVCDEETHLSFRVPAGDKGCAVATQYIMWDVDKTNCLSGVKPSGNEPTGPADDLRAEPPAPESPKE